MNTRERPPRVGGIEWQLSERQALGIYNANYSPSGTRIATREKPWNVFGCGIVETFRTHAEAIHYAFKEVGG